MIDLDISFDGLQFEFGFVSGIPLNNTLQFVDVDRNGVRVRDIYGNWGYVRYNNFSPYLGFNNNLELINYLYPFTQIGIVKTKKVEICSADFKVSNSTPIELIPAQGYGLIAMPTSIGYKMKFNSVQYDFGFDIYVHHSTKTNTDSYGYFNKTIFNAASDVSGIVPMVSETNDNAMVDNDSLVLKALTSDATVGNSHVTLWVNYVVIEESWYDGVYCV